MGPNIIAMYPSTSLFIAGGQLAIVVLVLFSYPLQVHPCRNCLDKVVAGLRPATPVAKPAQAAITAAQNGEGGEEEEDEDSIPPISEEDHQALEMSELKHVALTSVIVVLGFTVAYLVDDLQLGELVLCMFRC